MYSPIIITLVVARLKVIKNPNLEEEHNFTFKSQNCVYLHFALHLGRSDWFLLF